MGFLPGTGDGIGLEGSVIQHIPAEGQFLPFLLAALVDFRFALFRTR